MRHQLDHFTIGTAAADYKPPDMARGYPEEKIPDGMSARDLSFIVTGRAKNESGGAVNFTGAHLKAILAILFGEFTMWFGKIRQQLVDEAVTLDELRAMIQTATGRDVLVSTSSGIIEANALADATILAAAVADDATTEFTAVINRPFAVQRLAPEDRERHCPGATQLRQLGFKVRRRTGFTSASLVDAKWSQDGLVEVAFGPIPGVSRSDNWVEPMIVSRVNVDGSTHSHPGGKLVYFAERSAAESATALSLVTLKAGDEVVVNQGEAVQLSAEFAYTKPEGYESRASQETPIFMPPDGATYESLPTGDPIKFDQIGNAEINPADTLAIILPSPRDNFGAIAAANNRDSNIPDSEADRRAPILTNSATRDNPGVAQSTAAMAGLAIVKPEHRDYALTIGERINPKGGTTRVIPQSVIQRASNALSVAPTTAEKKAAAQTMAEAVAKSLPATGTAKRSGALKTKAAEVARNVLGSKFSDALTSD